MLGVRQKIDELIAEVQQVASESLPPARRSLQRHGLLRLQPRAGLDCVWGRGLRPGGRSSSEARGDAMSFCESRRRSFSASLLLGLRLSGRRREDGGLHGPAWNRGSRGQRESPGELGSGGGASLRSRHPRPVVPSRWVRVWAQPGCRALRGVR